MNPSITLQVLNPDDTIAVTILNDLSLNLYENFGSDGRNSFQDWKNDDKRYHFVIARKNNEIIGCGAIRPYDDASCELKRMYSKYRKQKIGQTILSYLETKAKEIGYLKVVLETRIKNSEARAFYIKAGYHQIPNYGKYQNNSDAICFEKKLY